MGNTQQKVTQQKATQPAPEPLPGGTNVNERSTAFPLGLPLYAGVPFIWQVRVRAHPPTATAKDFRAHIHWNYLAKDDRYDDLIVSDAGLGLAPAPQHVVVWNHHLYETEGNKKLKYIILPLLKSGGNEYAHTWGPFPVLPNPGPLAVAAGWLRFSTTIDRMQERMDQAGKDRLNQFRNEKGIRIGG